jgi:hypothetical protein
MGDDKTEDIMPPSESGRAKRAGPTIDLEATETSGETVENNAGSGPAQPASRPTSAVYPAVIAAVFGAGAAALIIAAVWLAGWPGETPSASAVPQANAAAIDALRSQMADLETRSAAAKSVATSSPDVATATRVETLEKSVTSLRDEIRNIRAQSEKLVANVNEIKSTPRETTPAPDLSAIYTRLAQIEGATRAEIAQESAKPLDDALLRRVVVASMLDASVRHGDAYAETLAAAKSTADHPETLKPLDRFAAAGVPGDAGLSRELLTLVPKLSPPTKENDTASSGFVDRLQAGAARLVRIERTDPTGNDRNAIVARVTAAALRNDPATAHRELNALAPADRATVQSWIDKLDARDAALGASRQFTADAMAALAKPPR